MNEYDYNREADLKSRLIKILNEFTADRQAFGDSVDINGLFRLKNALSSVNNLITLLATCGFVDYLSNRGIITDARAAAMKKAVQSQHANANGYDIDCIDGGVPVVAEIKCNIPVKGNEFGSAQQSGILKDITGLLQGKKRIKPDNAYKFMVILNTDKCSDGVDTHSAVKKLLSKINAEYSKVMLMPDDNSSLTMNTVYIVVLEL